MSGLHHLKISAPKGHAAIGTTVELDGVRIENALRAVDLHLAVDDITTATLDVVYFAGEFVGDAKVVVPEETRALLKQLGWTPPEGVTQ